jgi:hypothetical protein
VLPADLADTVRNMTGTGTGTGGGGGGGPITINTSGGDFIHKDQLASLLKKMGRDFKFVGK